MEVRKICLIFVLEKNQKNKPMGKMVIVSKSLKTGEKRVFETQEEASEALGVSSTSLSIACNDGRETKGYLVRRAERIYLVRLRAHNLWMVCVRNARGAYVEMGNPYRKIVPREYDAVRDVTAGWYFQEEK